MVTVKFFGLIRLELDICEVSVSAGSVKELFSALNGGFEKLRNVNFKDYIVLVNGTNITNLQMFRTKLNDGDGVTILSPVSGG